MRYERKHRIAGAVILLLGFALIIPMILREPTIPTGFEVSDQEPAPAIEQDASPTGSGALKSAGTGQQESTIVMVKQDPDTREAEGSADADGAAATVPETALRSSAAAPSQSGSGTNETHAEQAAEKQWIVRVGTFAKQENVRSVTELLDRNGFDPNETRVNSGIGEATRIWLGPYPDLAAAKKVSRELKELVGEDGYVTLYEP